MKDDFRLSACIIVKEGANLFMLKKCMDSIKNEVDEIIILTTYIETREDGVYEESLFYDLSEYLEIIDLYWEAWEYDFSKARNECKKQATGDVVFFIDADEEFITADTGKLKETLQSVFIDENGICKMGAATINIDSPPMGKTQPIRFMTNSDKINYFGIFNESPIMDLQKVKAEIWDIQGPYILHHGWETPQLMAEKEKRNMQMLDWHIQNPKNRDEEINYMAIRAGINLKKRNLISAELDINNAIGLLTPKSEPLTSMQVWNTAALISASYKRLGDVHRRCMMSISFEMKANLSFKQVLPRILIAETFEIQKQPQKALSCYEEAREAIIAGSQQPEFQFTLEHCDKAIAGLNQIVSNIIRIN